MRKLRVLDSCLPVRRVLGVGDLAQRLSADERSVGCGIGEPIAELLDPLSRDGTVRELTKFSKRKYCHDRVGVIVPKLVTTEAGDGLSVPEPAFNAQRCPMPEPEQALAPALFAEESAPTWHRALPETLQSADDQRRSRQGKGTRHSASPAA